MSAARTKKTSLSAQSSTREAAPAAMWWAPWGAPAASPRRISIALIEKWRAIGSRSSGRQRAPTTTST